MNNILKITFFLFVLTFCASCTDEAPANDGPKETPVLTDTGNPNIDALSQKIVQSPKDHTLYAQRAQEYYVAEGYDEALADLAQALKIDSVNVDYHHLLADVYLDYYKSQQALATMERAAYLYPDRIPTLLKLSEFQVILQQYDESLKTIEQILKLEPYNPEAYVMMGMTFEAKGDEARAINSFQTAIENDPSLADVWIKLGQLLAKQDSKIALRYFDNAIANAPEEPMTYYAKAEYLHNDEQYDGALEALRQTIAKNPRFDEAYFRTGVVYLEMDSLDQAYKNFNIVANSNPTLAKAYYYRGLVAELQGNAEQAINDFQQTLNLDAGFERARVAMDKLKETKQ